MKEREYPIKFSEICGNCGKRYGLHHAGSSSRPQDYCPNDSMYLDWEKAPGTCFKSTGKYEEKRELAPIIIERFVEGGEDSHWEVTEIKKGSIIIKGEDLTIAIDFIPSSKEDKE